MPKKKEKTLKKFNQQVADFTINDSANASKCGNKIKKSTLTVPAPTELAWDQIADDDLDIVEEIDDDGTKTFVYKKKRNHSKTEQDIENRPGVVYPEIVWYLIARFVRPEDVGRFAAINKSTYAITKRESFWTSLYRDFCEGHPKLPTRLRLENSYKVYGLRQRVIRSLYHTYDVFVKRVAHEAAQDSRPHSLVKRRCVNVWFCKGPLLWSIFFKFKRQYPHSRLHSSTTDDFVEELGRVDANPEEESKVLQVTCQSFYEVPPLMGMILTSVSVVLSQGFRHHRMHLGFNTGCHVSRDILPECTVVLDTVVNIVVMDWWHPKYPHFDNRLPSKFTESDESLPVLKNDFFTTHEEDL
ncbi:hypothetical protein ABMA27_002404 [Loxostege sticticalis]|uniref:Transmembrane protein 183 n=1 Tax=Loxostege sticticalis TaxID=481309 RepID=A0ABR3HTJ2_LOXSC